MTNNIALLRGINVGGHKKVSMAELKEVLNKSGLQNVQTYIQSGNVIFKSLEEDKAKLKALIENAIVTHFGFEVPVLVLNATELMQIFNNCPFPQEKKENSYFMMLYSKPDTTVIKEVSQLKYPNEEFKITNQAVYFYCNTGYGKAKFSNNFFEQKLKITATARNYRTMVKLLSLLAE